MSSSENSNKDKMNVCGAATFHQSRRLHSAAVRALLFEESAQGSFHHCESNLDAYLDATWETEGEFTIILKVFQNIVHQLSL